MTDLKPGANVSYRPCKSDKGWRARNVGPLSAFSQQFAPCLVASHVSKALAEFGMRCSFSHLTSRLARRMWWPRLVRHCSPQLQVYLQHHAAAANPFLPARRSTCVAARACALAAKCCRGGGVKLNRPLRALLRTGDFGAWSTAGQIEVRGTSAGRWALLSPSRIPIYHSCMLFVTLCAYRPCSHGSGMTEFAWGLHNCTTLGTQVVCHVDSATRVAHARLHNHSWFGSLGLGSVSRMSLAHLYYTRGDPRG